MFHSSFSLTLNLVGGRELVSVCQIEFFHVKFRGSLETFKEKLVWNFSCTIPSSRLFWEVRVSGQWEVNGEALRPSTDIHWLKLMGRRVDFWQKSVT